MKISRSIIQPVRPNSRSRAEDFGIFGHLISQFGAFDVGSQGNLEGLEENVTCGIVPPLQATSPILFSFCSILVNTNNILGHFLLTFVQIVNYFATIQKQIPTSKEIKTNTAKTKIFLIETTFQLWRP